MKIKVTDELVEKARLDEGSNMSSLTRTERRALERAGLISKKRAYDGRTLRYYWSLNTLSNMRRDK